MTNLKIFSSALPVERMQEYTKGENGCGEDGDYLSWGEMQWNLHGDAKVEHMDAEEACSVQPLVFTLVDFLGWSLACIFVKTSEGVEFHL